VDHDWQGYEGHVAVPTGASQMDIVFELQGEGQVWFDELVIDD
jgi:hypothetical protein